MTLLESLEREARILATRAKRSKWPKAKSSLTERSIRLSEGAARLREEMASADAFEERTRPNAQPGWTAHVQMLERINGGPK